MKDIRKDILWRVYLLYFVVLVFGLAIVGRVVYIQLTEGDALQMVSQEKEYKFFSLEANRGNISDCNNNLLATSVPVFEIRMDVDSENISDKLFNDKADSLALCLAQLFKGKNKSHYLSKLKKARKDGNRYLLIERNASYENLKELRSFPIFRLGKYRGGLITIPKTVRKMPFELFCECCCECCGKCFCQCRCECFRECVCECFCECYCEWSCKKLARTLDSSM